MRKNRLDTTAWNWPCKYVLRVVVRIFILMQFLLVILPVLGGRGALANELEPWIFDPNLAVDPSFEAQLKLKFPGIRSPEDLTSILHATTQKRPFSALIAQWDDTQQKWVIKGKQGKLVKDILVDSRARLIRQPLYNATQSFIAQVDALETRQRVIDTSMRHLKRKGYREAQVDLKALIEGNGVAYELIVNEGNPCVIRGIDWGFKLPRDVDFGLKAGDICDQDEILSAMDELLSSLRDLGYTQLKIKAEDLRYDPDQDAAILPISGILGQRVRYEIVDENRLFLIDDLFNVDELTRVDPTIVGPDAMAAELVRRYRQRGFLDAAVEGPEVKQKEQDLFVYIFSVKPGRQYMISETKFEGVTVFSDDQLTDIMGLRSFWQTSVPANFEEVQTGLNALKGRYQQLGYWEAKIRDPGMGQRDRETGAVRLVIQVEEGRQVRLGQLKFTGIRFGPKEEIMDLVKAQKGEPLDRSQLVDWQQELKSLYVSRGYLYAEVEYKFKPKVTRKIIEMDLEIEINEGSLVHVGDITIRGLNQTSEKVVRRELLFATGEWYSTEDISKSRQNLASLGIFRSVQIAPEDKNAYSQKMNVIDLVVEVQESRAGVVAFGPGWSLNKGFNYGVEASYANIGGQGRQASIRGSFSEERDQYAIGNKTLVGRKFGAGYTEPYLLDVPVDMRIKIHQKAEWSGELWGLRFGGEVEFVHKLRDLLEHAQVATFYSQEIARTEGSSIKEDQLLATNVRIGSFGLRLNYDLRDNPTFPLKGFVLDQELSWARYELGGDLRYFKWDFSGAHYFGITDRFVIALGLGAQSYDSVGRKGDVVGVLPPSERLFSGGVDTVRGYETRSLGPVVRSPVLQYNKATGNCDISYTNSNLFGSGRTTIKLELRHKVSEDIAFTGFTDSGNVFLSRDQVRKFNQAYEEAVPIPDAVPDNSPCQDLRLSNRVQENFPYGHNKLFTDPLSIRDKHFFSYGGYLSWLLPVGSVNAIYGLPWKEPEDPICQASPSECLTRTKQKGHWLTRGVWYLNVGARF